VDIIKLREKEVPQRTIASIIGHSTTTVHSYCQHIFQKSTNTLWQLIDETKRLVAFMLLQETKQKKYTTQELADYVLHNGITLPKKTIHAIIQQQRTFMKIDYYFDTLHLPGEAVQFDWGHIRIPIDGKLKTIYLAVFMAPYSKYIFAVPTLSCRSESFVEAFQLFTKEINGVFPHLRVDNMRIARAYRRKADDPKTTALFQELEQHYGFRTEFCTPRCPHQKGSVENAVRSLKRFLQDNIRPLYSLEDIQKTVSTFLYFHNHFQKGSQKSSPLEKLQNEKSRFLALPKKHYVYFQTHERKVKKNGMISFESNSYSVPEEYINQTVQLKVSKYHIYILGIANQIICKYTRCYGKNRRFYRVWHMKQLISKRPYGFETSHMYRQLPGYLKAFYLLQCKRDNQRFATFLHACQRLSKKKIKHVMKVLKEMVEERDKTRSLTQNKTLLQH
jgi:transposase